MGHVLEVVQQLRGVCGERQVEGAEIGFVGTAVDHRGPVLMTNEIP